MIGKLGFGVAVFAIGLSWLGARGLYWNGYYTEDAPGYVADAIWIALGNYQARHHVNGLNVGTYAPIALPIAFLGKTEFALSVWPLLCSLLGVVSLGGLTGILYGRSYGLLAALLYATYPGDVFFSTVVMPDAIQSGWLSLSIFLVVWSFSGNAHRTNWGLLAGGLAMGVCHLIRANGALLLPVGVWATAILSRTWKREALPTVVRHCLAYLAGWFLIAFAEALTYVWAADDLLLRFHVVNQHYGTAASLEQWGLNTDPQTIPFSAFAPLMWWARGNWGALNEEQAYHGLLFSWALVVVLIGIVSLKSSKRTIPDRAPAGFILAVFWFAWPLLYHQFGSQSLTEYVPIHRLPRHLVVYAPGAILAIVAGWYLIREATRPWRVTSALLPVAGCCVLAVHLYFNWRSEEVAYEAYHRIERTYLRILERLPRDVRTIAGDPGDLHYFDFWLNPLEAERVRISAFANYSRCEELKDGVVITRSNPGWKALSAPVIQETVTRLPCLLEPPPNWRLLYDGYPEKVYVIGGAVDPQPSPPGITPGPSRHGE